MKMLFYDLSLEELHGLATTWEENPSGDVGQITSLSIVYYFIFLKASAMGDLQQAIHRAEEAVAATQVDDPDHTTRLKDLIVMLVKKYERTNSLEDLEGVILRAKEMVTVTPPEHPDRLARLKDLIVMMGKKYLQTRSREDLDEMIFMAEQVCQ